MNRIKYPLTDSAKQAARELVTAWDSGDIRQLFSVIEVTAMADDEQVIIEGIGANIAPPPLRLLFELAEYRLLSMKQYSEDGWNILMLQELRNAVEKDFEVSDFFLTTATVGTVINLGEGASVMGIQSIAINYGTAVQNVEQLADRLIKILGEPLIQANAEIRNAVEQLRRADMSNQVSRVGTTIEMLGRYLAHTGSAASVVAGIQMLAQFLSR